MSTLHNFIAAYARPFTLHLLVSSIVLTFALLVSFSTRLTSRTRFAVIAIGVAKFLVPASLFTPLVRRFAPAMPLIVARVAGGAFSVRTPQQTAISVTIIDVIALAWIGIAIILIAATLIVHRRLVHAALRDAATPTQRETSALDAARRRIGIDHGVDIIRSPLCEAPAVLRILRPVVVLPLHGSEPLDDDELESLLAHECAHVARRDNFIALIEALLRAVFWFNPLLWLAHRRLIVEREKACDEIVADTADRAGTYAAAIEKMCDAIINRPVAGVACMAGSNLKERLEHIMSYSSLRTKAISHALAVAFAAILILASTAASAAMLFGNLGPSNDAQPYDVTITIDKTNDGHSMSPSTPPIMPGNVASGAP